MEDARRRAGRQRLVLAIVGLALAAVVGIVLVVRAKSDSGGSAAATTTTASTSTTLPSVRGKPCVAMKGTPPKDTPTVPVQVGPPPKQLIIRDLAQGTGAAVKPGATVKLHYVLVLCSSGKVVESSFKSGDPITVSLDQVIPGWTEGVPGMKAGGVRLLGVPPDLGYGSTGSSGIAPDETLWFVVKLLKIEK
jgi:peptidylprolyl isomerase